MKTSQALLRKAFGFLGLMLLAVACHQPTSDDLPLVSVSDVGVSASTSNLSLVTIIIGQVGPDYYSDVNAHDLLDWSSMVSVPNHKIISFTTSSDSITLQLDSNLSQSSPEQVDFNTDTIFYSATADGVNIQKCHFSVASCQITIR